MSDPIAQTITLAAIEPNAPLVLCDSKFLHTLATVEREVAHLAITDAQSAQAAANLQVRLTGAGGALEKARTQVKAPFLLKCKEIDEAAKVPAARIEVAKRLVQQKLVAFDTEQRRKAAEAEAARVAEVKRLEEQARKEAVERARKAEELAAQAVKKGVPTLDLDDMDIPDVPLPKTETEAALEAAKFAPAVEQAKPTGVAFRSTLRIASIDVAKLPEVFVVRTANEKALRATYCAGWKEGQPLPECPGVAFSVDRLPVSTGKGAF